MPLFAMHRNLGRIRLALAPLGLIVLLALCGTAPMARAGEAAASWHVTQVSGSARLRHGLEDWQPVMPGATIAPGTAIETGADARVVLASANDVVTVAPNSHVAVPAAKAAGGGADFLQTLGTLLFDIEHNPARHFEVDTPYLAAVVKGTAFTVTVRPDGGAVQVTRGAVQVASSLAPDIALVRPGQIARVPAVRGSHMTITDRGHTSIVPHTNKSKAELTEPDPGPASQNKDGHGSQGASSDAAASPTARSQGTPSAAVAAASAPRATENVTPDGATSGATPVAAAHGDTSSVAEAAPLDHEVSLSTSGLSAGTPQTIVITRTLGSQSVDISQATDGFVAAGRPNPPAAAVHIDSGQWRRRPRRAERPQRRERPGNGRPRKQCGCARRRSAHGQRGR